MLGNRILFYLVLDVDAYHERTFANYTAKIALSE